MGLVLTAVERLRDDCRWVEWFVCMHGGRWDGVWRFGDRDGGMDGDGVICLATLPVEGMTAGRIRGWAGATYGMDGYRVQWKNGDGE